MSGASLQFAPAPAPAGAHAFAASAHRISARCGRVPVRPPGRHPGAERLRVGDRAGGVAARDQRRHRSHSFLAACLVFTAKGVTVGDHGLSVTGELAIDSSRVRLEIPVNVEEMADGAVRIDGSTTVSREAAGVAWNKLGMIHRDAKLHAKLTLERASSYPGCRSSPRRSRGSPALPRQSGCWSALAIRNLDGCRRFLSVALTQPRRACDAHPSDVCCRSRAHLLSAALAPSWRGPLAALPSRADREVARRGARPSARRGRKPRRRRAPRAQGPAAHQPAYRARVAAGLARAVRDAEAGTRGFSAAVRPDRREVIGARTVLATLDRRLRATEPVSARGVALLELLLTDGTSSLYRPAEPGALGSELRAAAAALEPPARHRSARAGQEAPG